MAFRCPAATSSTWTSFKPVLVKTGMRPHDFLPGSSGRFRYSRVPTSDIRWRRGTGSAGHSSQRRAASHLGGPTDRNCSPLGPDVLVLEEPRRCASRSIAGHPLDVAAPSPHLPGEGFGKEAELNNGSSLGVQNCRLKLYRLRKYLVEINGSLRTCYHHPSLGIVTSNLPEDLTLFFVSRSQSVSSAIVPISSLRRHS